MLIRIVSPVMHAENEGEPRTVALLKEHISSLRNLRSVCLYNEFAFKLKYCLLQLASSSLYVFTLENQNKQSPGACQQQMEWMWKTERESIKNRAAYLFLPRELVSSCVAALLITTSILTTNPFSVRHSSQSANGLLEALMIAFRSSSIVSRKWLDTLEINRDVKSLCWTLQ